MIPTNPQRTHQHLALPVRTQCLTHRRAGLRLGKGFAYVEVMVALVLVVAALVPALEALQSGVRGSQEVAAIAATDPLLRAKMEEVLALPFDTLNAQTFLAGGNTTSSVSVALSDAAGASNRRIVILYRTDGSAVSAADTGLVRLRVAFEDGRAVAHEALKSKWW